jgi:hypothetical protein
VLAKARITGMYSLNPSVRL